MYKDIIRPFLFKEDPKVIHQKLLHVLQGTYRNLIPVRGWIRSLFRPVPDVFIWKGIRFKNRIGLAAGFDKNAEAYNELADFGFGFIEVGTFTPHPIEEPADALLIRLNNCDSLLHKTGFHNPGLNVVKERLKQRGNSFVLGVNINKDPQSEGTQAADDLAKMYSELAEYADYFTVNWGSMDAQELKDGLLAIKRFREDNPRLDRPVLVKVPAGLPLEKVDAVLTLIDEVKANGVIASGPTKDRSQLGGYTEEEINNLPAGAISGQAIGDKPYALVKAFREKGGEKLLIIGSGGIHSRADANRMRQHGADLLQIYSAFIFEGPGIVKRL